MKRGLSNPDLSQAESRRLHELADSRANGEEEVAQTREAEMLRYGKLSVRIVPAPGKPSSYFSINEDAKPIYFENDYFMGRAVVRVRDAVGARKTDYFHSKNRKFSIQLEGRFKQEYSGDDIMFGAWFDRPITPPFGTSIALSFVRLIDPAISHDLYAAKPWLLSPILCAMNQLTVMPVDDSNTEEGRPEKGFESLGRWRWGGGRRVEDEGLQRLGDKEWQGNARRSYFAKQSNRLGLTFTPSELYCFEFYSDTVDWNTFEASVGIRVAIPRYINGQPITFIAESKSTGARIFTISFDHTDLGSS